MAIDESKVNALIIAGDSRYVKKVAGKDLSSNDFTDAEKTKLAGLSNTVVDSNLDSVSTNPVQNKKVKEALDTKANTSDLAAVATTGAYVDLIGAPTLEEIGGIVSVEKQATAESGYAATYIVKQNNMQVGSKINIPKDFLVKSATVETVSMNDSPVTGYTEGDIYIDFVINTKEDDGTPEHLYLLVSDLIDTYQADESTITLNGDTFGVKAGGITTTHLASSIVTSLGYADNWNSSVAKNITSNDISSWNNKSDITQSDIEDAIEDYLDAITIALGQ